MIAIILVSFALALLTVGAAKRWGLASPIAVFLIIANLGMPIRTLIHLSHDPAQTLYGFWALPLDREAYMIESLLMLASYTMISLAVFGLGMWALPLRAKPRRMTSMGRLPLSPWARVALLLIAAISAAIFYGAVIGRLVRSASRRCIFSPARPTSLPEWAMP